MSASAYYERRGKREPPAARNDVPGSSLAERRSRLADPPANRFGRRGVDVLAPASRVRRRRASRARRQARASRAPSPDSVHRPSSRMTHDFAARAALGVVEVRHRRGDVTDPRGDVTGGGRYRSSFRVDEVVRAMRARREYVESYVQNAIAPHPRPMTKKKPNKRWPPSMDVGSVPAMDAVEARYPAHVCVLFRAIAHQQARRRGLIRDVDEDDGRSGRRRGFFRVFGFSGTETGRDARIVQLGIRRGRRRRGHERGRLGETRRRVRRRGARRGGDG